MHHTLESERPPNLQIYRRRYFICVSTTELTIKMRQTIAHQTKTSFIRPNTREKKETEIKGQEKESKASSTATGVSKSKEELAVDIVRGKRYETQSYSRGYGPILEYP